MNSAFWVLLISGAVVVLAIVLALILPYQTPLGRYLAERKRRQERAFWEDVLRQALQMEQDGRAVTVESLAGALGRPVGILRDVVSRMAVLELVKADDKSVRLSPQGTRWAMHVLRAHRLWESYLADEAGLPMRRLHHQAELAEHRLSAHDLAALDAQLGHPVEDPHGDPIPTAEGELAEPRGISLSLWGGGEHVRVVHVEDEPADIFDRLLAKGIRPGVSMRLESLSASNIEVWLDGERVTIEAELLANVEVAEDTQTIAADPAMARLSQIPTGEAAEIVALSDAIRGFSRRRLLDFGVTRGTRIAPVLDNPFGDPRAFRIRGTTIGIRAEQAREIWVRRIATEPNGQGVTA